MEREMNIIGKCCNCRMPVHRDDEKRYLGDRIAHVAHRCADLFRMRIAALEEALEPFANAPILARVGGVDQPTKEIMSIVVREEEIETARALLSAPRPEGSET